IVHAEDAQVIAAAPEAEGTQYSRFLQSRPRAAENVAISRVIELSRRTGCRVHILHLSSSDAIPIIAAAKRDGVRISAETCPHYLCFDAEQIPSGATQFKCCPPIREAGNRELLWQGLADGIIDTVVTDHSPSTVDLKRLDTGDFGDAWGGIASLQISLAAVWTEAQRRGFDLSDVVRWMATNTADQIGLHDRGRIAVGAVAHLVAFAPDQEFTVDVAELHHKNAVSAYDRLGLRGVVRRTFVASAELLVR
ncbi:MAG: amidohydrolase family protein, partial [Rhodococcus sp. (in: high G+C Gram-positive bacteria)]